MADLTAIKAIIGQMPLEDRVAIETAAISLRSAIEQHGEHGRMALALVGAETALKLEWPDAPSAG